MSGTPFVAPRYIPVNGSGTPYAAAKLYFFQAGTDTAANVYTTAALSTPHAVPVTASSGGMFAAIYLNPAAGYDYKAVCKSSGDVTLWTEDNIPSGALTAAIVGTALYPRTAAEISASVTPTDYSYPEGNVKRYGATGNGSTNDRAAIALAVSVVNVSGGKLVFPPSSGTYAVTFPTVTAYSSLFALKSNVTVEFQGGARMAVSAVTGSTLFASVFGVDPAALPVSNLRFLNLHITQAAAGGGQEQGQAITLTTDADDAANSIVDVLIDGCWFSGFGSAIYILQRTSSGSATRQVNGVTISNNIGAGNYTFITADGANILIEGNTAWGDRTTPANTYDGVSIHSGLNVRVVGNAISHFGDYGVQVRNNVNNLSGSQNITITGNTLTDVATQSIGVVLVAGETTYGVKGVTISGNAISNSNGTNTATGVYVSCGSAGAGTPFGRMTISDNTIDGTNTGIDVTCNSTVRLSHSTISGNSVYQLATHTGFGLYLKEMLFSAIADNTVLSAYTGAALEHVELDNVRYSSVTGNSIYSDSTHATAITGTNFYDTVFAGNTVTGKYSFTTLNSNCVFNGNRFASTGLVEARVMTGTWNLDNAQVQFYGDTTPASGTWVVGDKMVYATPTAGGGADPFIGEVCTSGGTPGTWKTYGAVSA